MRRETRPSRRESEFVRINNCKKTFLANPEQMIYMMLIVGIIFIILGYALIVKLANLPSISGFIGILIAAAVNLGSPGAGKVVFGLLNDYSVYGTLTNSQYTNYAYIGLLIMVAITIYMFIKRLMEFTLKHANKKLGLIYTLFRFGLDMSREFSAIVLGLSVAVLIYTYVLSSMIEQATGIPRQQLLFSDIISVIVAALIMIFLKSLDMYLSTHILPLGITTYAYNYVMHKSFKLPPCAEGSIELARDTGLVIDVETIHSPEYSSTLSENSDSEKTLHYIKKLTGLNIILDPKEQWEVHRPLKKGNKYQIMIEPISEVESSMIMSISTKHEEEYINIKCREYHIKARGPSFVDIVSVQATIKGAGDEIIDEKTFNLEHIPINIKIKEIRNIILNDIGIPYNVIKDIKLMMYKETETGQEVIVLEEDKRLRNYLAKKYPIPDMIELDCEIRLRNINMEIIIDDRFTIRQEVPITTSLGELLGRIASKIPGGIKAIKFVEIQKGRYTLDEVREFTVGNILKPGEKKISIKVYTRYPEEEEGEEE